MRRVAQQGLFIGFAYRSGRAVVFIFAPSLFLVFKVTPEALPIGTAYLRMLVFSMPFQALLIVIGAILRGIGNTKIPMQIAVVTNVIIVALNSVLIFGRFGFPALGFRGPPFPPL